jgi:hypothetical protein
LSQTIVLDFLKSKPNTYFTSKEIADAIGMKHKDSQNALKKIWAQRWNHHDPEKNLPGMTKRLAGENRTKFHGYRKNYNIYKWLVPENV